MALEYDDPEPDGGHPILGDVIGRLMFLMQEHGNVRVILECDWSAVGKIEFVPEGKHPVLVNEGDIVLIDSVRDIPF